MHYVMHYVLWWCIGGPDPLAVPVDTTLYHRGGSDPPGGGGANMSLVPPPLPPGGERPKTFSIWGLGTQRLAGSGGLQRGGKLGGGDRNSYCI